MADAAKIFSWRNVVIILAYGAVAAAVIFLRPTIAQAAGISTQTVTWVAVAVFFIIAIASQFSLKGRTRNQGNDPNG